MNILVIGSANADLVISTEQMPALGETVSGHDFAVNAGGKGLNQSVAISKLGGEVSFLGLVGNDPNGKMLLDTFREYGVNFAGKAVDSNSTGVALITVVGADNFIVLNAGANGDVTPEFIEENSHLIDAADYIVLQLEIPMETIVKICCLAKKGKAKVILNPAPYKELPKSLYPLIDYLIPNEHEAGWLTGMELTCRENCEKAVQQLQTLGIPNVIITLGDKGCVYNHQDSIIFHPAQKTTAVDTTSAGDSFIGALTVKLSEGVSLPDAIAYGTNDWHTTTRDLFQKHCKGFIKTVSEKNPQAQIFVITPVWRKDCQQQMPFGPFADLEKIIRSSCAKLPNVQVVRGFDLIPKEEAYFADRKLHPNDAGFCHYAQSLCKELARLIK